MSWSSPTCPLCSSPSTRYECSACRARSVELGVALADRGRPAEALQVYEAALAHEREPELRAILLSNSGGCLSALGRRREAEARHRQALAADPEHLGVHWNLFAHLLGSERYADALAAIEVTIRLPFLTVAEVENLEAYRSEVLIAMGRYLDALVAIDRSLVSDPNELQRLTTRARILMHLARVATTN